MYLVRPVTRTIAILIPLMWLTAAAAHAQHGVTVKDHRVTLIEFDASIELPLHWSAATVPEDSDSDFEREELQALRRSTREWDQQYCIILNSFLPFEALAFQAGEKSWKGHATVFDPFMRVYVVEFSPREIWRRLNDSGARAIDEATKGRGPDPSYSFEPYRKYNWEKKLMWDFSRISYAFELWFGDYGGRTRVDLF